VEINPVCRGIVTVRELDSAHFTDDHGTGVYEALNRRTGSVLRRVEVVEGAVAAAGA
jgi:hypothetical protein